MLNILFWFHLLEWLSCKSRFCFSSPKITPSSLFFHPLSTLRAIWLISKLIKLEKGAVERSKAAGWLFFSSSLIWILLYTFLLANPWDDAFSKLRPRRKLWATVEMMSSFSFLGYTCCWSMVMWIMGRVVSTSRWWLDQSKKWTLKRKTLN